MHIVILNPVNGKVETVKVFDTYESSEKFENFINNDIPYSYIIVAACKDECMTHLSRKCKLWFTNMGSKDVWKIEYRKGFAFIGVSGKWLVNEMTANVDNK